MTIYGLFLLNENSRGPWTRQTFFDFLNGIFPLGICVERCVKLSRLLILRHSSRFLNAYCFSQTAHSYLVLFQWTYIDGYRPSNIITDTISTSCFFVHNARIDTYSQTLQVQAFLWFMTKRIFCFHFSSFIVFFIVLPQLAAFREKKSPWKVAFALAEMENGGENKRMKRSHMCSKKL